jgi:predicted RNA binding protein YcfA (HicA-like mRNA interferase family)
MPMTGKEMLKRYLQSGWKLDRVTGSHHIVVKGSVSVSIPVHSGKALKRGTEQKLLKLGGFT